MKLLYISSFCTPKLFDYVFKSSTIKPGQAVQKFHKLLIEGFNKLPQQCSIEVLSTIPVTTKGHSKIWWNVKKEVWQGVKVQYVPFLNFFKFKHLFIFFSTFYKVILWRLQNKKESRIVICDILNNGIVWSTFLACKFTRQKMAVLVTDLPEMMISSRKKTKIVNILLLRVSMYVLHRFDYYVILTEQMNAVVNPKNKPFLVMEGLVDENIILDNNKINKNQKKILLYAGGIFIKYGVKNLLDAFLFIQDSDVELHIYGSGDLEDKMGIYCSNDERIKYFGVVENKLVVSKLDEAMLLINPRPTTEEFTKYSFPSKNLEYMVSGTPLLTSKLPGMPIEYYEYVYLLEDETVEGIANKLKLILALPTSKLLGKGKEAKSFVLKHKTNRISATKIINLLNA